MNAKTDTREYQVFFKDAKGWHLCHSPLLTYYRAEADQMMAELRRGGRKAMRVPVVGTP